MVIWHAFNSLPHWHRKMVLILSIMVMMLAAWPSEQAVATRVDDNGNELAMEQQVDEEALLTEAKPVAPPKPSYITKQVKVRSGDNMGSSSSASASAPRICTSSTSSRARIPCACSSRARSSPSSSPRAASCIASTTPTAWSRR